MRLFDVADDENEKVVSAGIVRENEDDDGAIPDNRSKAGAQNGGRAATASADMDNEDPAKVEKMP